MKLHDLNEGALEGRAIACIGKPAINAIKKDLHPHFKLFYDSANALMNDVKKQIKAFKDTQRDDLKDAYVTRIKLMLGLIQRNSTKIKINNSQFRPWLHVLFREDKNDLLFNDVEEGIEKSDEEFIAGVKVIFGIE